MTNDRLAIRDARPDERRLAAELTAASYRQYADEYGARWDNYLAMLRRTVETAPATHIVAELGGTLVGSVLLFMPGADPGYPGERVAALARPEVRFLAVATSARGRGVGEALMRKIFAAASASGFTEVGLHTLEFMVAARALYARLGFVRSPEDDTRSPMGVIAEGYRIVLPVRDNQ